MPDFIAVDEINSQVITSESNIINKTSDTFSTIKKDTNTLLNISNKVITQPSVTYENNVTNKVYLISKPEEIINSSFDKTFVSTNTTFVVNTSFIQASDETYVYVDITDEPGTDVLARNTYYYRSGWHYSSLVVSNATIGKTYKVSIHGYANFVNSCTVENLDSSLYNYNNILVNSPITSNNKGDIKQIGSFHSEGYGALNLIYSVPPRAYTEITVNKNGVSNTSLFTSESYIEGTDSSTYLATIPVEYNDDLVFFFKTTKNNGANINYARLSTSIVDTQGTNTIKRIQRGVAYANTGKLGTYEIKIAPCNPQKSLCLLNSELPLQQLNYANFIVGDTTNQKGTVSYQIIEFF